MKKVLKTAFIMASAAMIVSCTGKNKDQKEAGDKTEQNTDNNNTAPASTGNGQSSNLTKSGLNPLDFETTYNDEIRGEKPIKLYTLTNHNGMEVCITNMGGRIVSIMAPDKDGNLKDVVLSYPTAKDFFPEVNGSDFGASIGRYANRINKGQFPLEGKTIQLETNNYGHMLHGYDRPWQYIPYDAEQPDSNIVMMYLTSPDGEGHFPGKVDVKVTMKLTDDNAIDITYEGTTDATTILNMTNHSYFNLSGDPSKPITDHIIQIDADNYTPTDSTYMTTGEIKKVDGTCFDLRKPTEVGKYFANGTVDPLLIGDKEMKDGVYTHSGYDHNWCLNTYKNGKGDDTKVCASCYCPSTGIQLDVYTNEPGIQFYTGNFQDGTVVGKKGIKYPKNAALCLETQKYPNAPNNPNWPSCTLKPGEKYFSRCVFKFSIHK